MAAAETSTLSTLLHRPSSGGAVGLSRADLCEANYAVTPKIAEFWNFVSSFTFVGIGLYGLYLSWRHRYEWRFVICYALLTVVGISSAAFHGTLSPVAQICDELLSLYCSLFFLWTIQRTDSAFVEPPEPTEFEALPLQTRLNFEHLMAPAKTAVAADGYMYSNGGMTTSGMGDPAGGGGGGGFLFDDELNFSYYLAPGLVLFALLLTYHYLTGSESFQMFFVMYAGCMAYLLHRSRTIYRRSTTPKHQKYLIAAAFGLFVAGWLLFWLPTEVLWCEETRWLQLHAWFHVASAIAPYCWITMAVWQRYTFKKKSPEVRFGMRTPLPAVVFPPKKPRAS